MKDINEKIIRAISEGIQNALDFTLDDFNDSDKDYIQKKDSNLETLDKDEYEKMAEKVFYPLVDQMLQGRGLSTEQRKKFDELSKIYTYPATDIDIERIIGNVVHFLGNEADLNWIDVSNVTNMACLFGNHISARFVGDISKWDVSNVENMESMFMYSSFGGDISGWDVSSVTNMSQMFRYADFNQDISSWAVNNVTNMDRMFQQSCFEGNISEWNVDKVETFENIFQGCDIPEENKPEKFRNK